MRPRSKTVVRSRRATPSLWALRAGVALSYTATGDTGTQSGTGKDASRIEGVTEGHNFIVIETVRPQQNGDTAAIETRGILCLRLFKRRRRRGASGFRAVGYCCARWHAHCGFEGVQRPSGEHRSHDISEEKGNREAGAGDAGLRTPADCRRVQTLVAGSRSSHPGRSLNPTTKA